MKKIQDPKAFVTNKTLGEAVDTLLKGMDNMLDEQKKIFATKEDLKGFATKEDLKGFATKEDLKGFATKEDLKTEIGWVRDDIKGLTADLSDTVSKKEFNQLKGKVDKYLVS